MQILTIVKALCILALFPYIVGLYSIAFARPDMVTISRMHAVLCSHTSTLYHPPTHCWTGAIHDQSHVYCSIFGDTLLMCCASVASYPVPIHSCANPLKYHPNTCRSMQNLKVQFYVHTTKHLNCNYDHRTNGNVPLHGNVEQSLLWMKH